MGALIVPLGVRWMLDGNPWAPYVLGCTAVLAGTGVLTARSARPYWTLEVTTPRSVKRCGRAHDEATIAALEERIVGESALS